MNGDKVKSAAIAGVGIGVVSAIPLLNYCCVLWGAGGGALAVRLYSKTGGGRAVTQGEGAGLGATTGAIASAVFFALSAPLTILLTPEETFQELMRMTGQEAPIGRVPLLLIASAISAVVVFVATTIGGLIGASLFKPKGGPPPDAGGAAPYGATSADRPDTPGY